MKENRIAFSIVIWFLKRIFLPLLPVIIGYFLRLLYLERGGIDLIDGIELSFSMAMLSILVLESSFNITDKNDREFINVIIWIQIVIFLGLFASQTLIEILLEDGINELNSMSNSLKFYSLMIAGAFVIVNIVLKLNFRLEE
jgi:hypothetical protein